MGLLSGALGNAAEVDVSKIEDKFTAILITGEQIAKAYSLVRDLIVFTNKRMILMDKQGMTGKKTEYMSIPYKNVQRFAMETAGHVDLDSELKIWLSGLTDPLVMQFKRGNHVFEATRVLSQYAM